MSNPYQPIPKPVQPQTRQPFQQDQAPNTQQKKLDLKMDNKASFVPDLPKQPSREDGQKLANETNARMNGYTAQAGKLALAFKEVVNDKTLALNKSIIAKDAEKGLITDLIMLGTAINNDTREEEGRGSMTINALLLGTVLAQRDKINELAYADEQHAKHITALEKKLKAIEMVMEAQSAIDKPIVNG